MKEIYLVSDKKEIWVYENFGDVVLRWLENRTDCVIKVTTSNQYSNGIFFQEISESSLIRYAYEHKIYVEKTKVEL